MLDLQSTATGLEFASVLVAGLAIALSFLAAPSGRQRSAWTRGNPLWLAGAAAVLLGLAAAAQWMFTHAVLDAGFVPTHDGWRRIALADTFADDAIRATASVQRTVAVCIGALVPIAWCVVWTRRWHDVVATVAGVTATVAMTLPVLVACAGVVWLTDIIDGSAAEDAIWVGWNALETTKWGVTAVAAIGLMGATPLVMHAARRGHVVGDRLYRVSQYVLLAGLAAWSISRFPSADLERGPVASLLRGASPWHDRAETRGLPSIRTPSLDLPTGGQCVVPGLTTQQHQVLAIEVDHRGNTLNAGTWEPSAAGREPVLAAAIDRRTPASAYQPALLRAQALGVRRIAVLTHMQETETSLTLGKLHSSTACALGWLDMGQALQLSERGTRWTTLAYASRASR